MKKIDAKLEEKLKMYDSVCKQRDELEQKLAELEKEVAWLREKLRLYAKWRFASSSEKTVSGSDAGLINLFDEAELAAAEGKLEDDSASEQEETITVSSHKRRKKRINLIDELPDDIEVEIIEHDLSEEEKICSICGAQMELIGTQDVVSLVLEPAKYIKRIHRYRTYKCQQCDEQEGETVIKETPRQETFLPKTYASPEIVSYLITEKFVMYNPLYRMEQYFKRSGVLLSRQTMSNWMLTATEEWLKPLYIRLHKELLARDILHADETTLQVLAEEGRSAQAKSYMWLYRTGNVSGSQIVLYDYRPGRSSQYPQEFLSGFKGYLHVDGYASYDKLPDGIIRLGCWAHVRRKFTDALESLPKGKSSLSIRASQGLAYCNKLFALEKALAKLNNEERQKQRLKLEKPLLQEIFAWAEKQEETSSSKTHFGRALGYLLGQRKKLTRYLEDGRLEISNNRAERSIKPFVMGRKNFLFAATPRGAEASAIMYSIVETAKENHLDPYSYLCYIFEQAPKLKLLKEDWVEELLPENVPESCRAGKRRKF